MDLAFTDQAFATKLLSRVTRLSLFPCFLNFQATLWSMGLCWCVCVQDRNVPLCISLLGPVTHELPFSGNHFRDMQPCGSGGNGMSGMGWAAAILE